MFRNVRVQASIGTEFQKEIDIVYSLLAPLKFNNIGVA